MRSVRPAIVSKIHLVFLRLSGDTRFALIMNIKRGRPLDLESNDCIYTERFRPNRTFHSEYLLSTAHTHAFSIIMFFTLVIGVTFLDVFSAAMPQIRVERSLPLERFTLPDNATTIRENIDTSFTCDTRPYGYYADPENDCQIFHVCLPVLFAGQRSETFMWSFICPQDTIFNQERFTCTRLEDSIPCQESAMFYSLNDKFGQPEVEEAPTIVDPPIETSQEDNSLETGTTKY